MHTHGYNLQRCPSMEWSGKRCYVCYLRYSTIMPSRSFFLIFSFHLNFLACIPSTPAERDIKNSNHGIPKTRTTPIQRTHHKPLHKSHRPSSPQAHLPHPKLDSARPPRIPINPRNSHSLLYLYSRARIPRTSRIPSPASPPPRPPPQPPSTPVPNAAADPRPTAYPAHSQHADAHRPRRGSQRPRAVSAESAGEVPLRDRVRGRQASVLHARHAVWV